MKTGDLGHCTGYAVGRIQITELSRLRTRGTIPPVPYIFMV